MAHYAPLTAGHYSALFRALLNCQKHTHTHAHLQVLYESWTPRLCQRLSVRLCVQKQQEKAGETEQLAHHPCSASQWLLLVMGAA